MAATEADRPTDARARLLSHFSVDESQHGQKWDELYKENFLPWDKGFPNPAFEELLSERKELLPSPVEGRRLKALVPGCGKGYDVLLLSAFGYDAYGLEVSNRALDAARETEVKTRGDEMYTSRGGEKGNATWLLGDFFKDDFLNNVTGEENFDLIYDYTVRCP
jgi:SAM-dependent methyltransferase